MGFMPCAGWGNDIECSIILLRMVRGTVNDWEIQVVVVKIKKIA